MKNTTNKRSNTIWFLVLVLVGLSLIAFPALIINSNELIKESNEVPSKKYSSSFNYGDSLLYRRELPKDDIKSDLENRIKSIITSSEELKYDKCLDYKTFKNNNINGKIYFSKNRFEFTSSRPVSVTWGYYEKSGNLIRLIRAQKSSILPSYIQKVDCRTISISGILFTR